LSESYYGKNPGMCGFGTLADFNFATSCCLDSIFAELNRPERELCPNVITGVPEACDFYVASTCCPGGSGIALPLGFLYDFELDMPIVPRGAAYFALLLWLFMGVMIISDSFMAAIEEITAAKTEKFRMVDGQKRRYTVPVWNATVANLTLMALGSSAPEILLAVIELYGNNYYSGKLGASTIVGSAAFNFFVITAVCITAIPDGEVRYIEQTQVYYITLSFSLFAYVWILIVIQLSTPDVISLGEACLTLVFFPILTALAYLADIGKICPAKAKVADGEEDLEGVLPNALDVSIHGDPDEVRAHLSAIVKSSAKAYGDDAENKAMERIIKLQSRQSEVRSRAYYRVNASRGLTGGKKIEKNPVQHESHRVRTSIKEAIKEWETNDPELLTTTIEFAAPFYSCLESDKAIEIEVLRAGPATDELTVTFCTRDGTATAGHDYYKNSGEIKFEAGQIEQKIKIELVDDDEHEPDKDFFVDLDFSTPSQPPKGHKLGDVRTTVITIIDDDEPGVLSFTEDDFFVQESEKKAVVWVQRKDGCSANVSCTYTCEDKTGKSGKDYEESTGSLMFKKGETRKSVEIPLISQVIHNKTVMFAVVLSEPTGGAKFDSKTDGGEETCITQVHISPSEESKNKIDNLYSLLRANTSDVHLGGSSWPEQFVSAIYVNGSKEEQAEASKFDWLFHLLTLPFKIIFAFTPPPQLCGGWLAFFGALGFIGALTAVVGDTASIFGCILAIPDEISAITLVAVGTSLPDTFASKSAAQAEPYADSSVGNVTGSNSVNVFLGLGIAWIVGALFWHNEGPTEEWLALYKNQVVTGTDSVVPDMYPDGGFVVPAGALAFSVLVYSILAAIGAALLQWRRVQFGGELGGPQLMQIITGLVFFLFWCAYIGANIAFAYLR
jgi:solute carrier family 8 (sodium/calcium exchanger)